MKLLKYTITVVLLISLAACSVNEENFPVPLDTVLNKNGAYLRVLSVESAGFDILDLDNAAYIFNGEVFDREEGDLLENVEFYVSYTSTDGVSIDETDQPIETYPASAFTRGGARNLPQATFNISLDEVLGPLGLTRDDVLIGDQFRIRWVVNLTNGDSFSASDANTVVTGGAFFSSPYLANASVVAAIPPDRFVGSYTITQNEPATFGLVYTTASTEIELQVDPNNTLNGRTYQAEYLGSFGFGVGPKVHNIGIALANDPADNSVTLTSLVDSGLSCGGPGLFIGPEQENISSFDVNDDSQFVLGMTENIQSGCSAGSVQVSFDAVKN